MSGSAFSLNDFTQPGNSLVYQVPVTHLPTGSLNHHAWPSRPPMAIAARGLADTAIALPRSWVNSRTRSASDSARRFAGETSDVDGGASSTGCSASAKAASSFPVARLKMPFPTMPCCQGLAPVTRVACPGPVRALAYSTRALGKNAPCAISEPSPPGLKRARIRSSWSVPSESTVTTTVSRGGLASAGAGRAAASARASAAGRKGREGNPVMEGRTFCQSGPGSN